MADGLFGGCGNSEVLFFILIFLCLFYDRCFPTRGIVDKC